MTRNHQLAFSTYPNRSRTDLFWMICFEVYTGEAFCLVGRSGVGKSVTLKLLIGFLKPDAGQVFISGSNIGELDRFKLAEVRTKVGFLFQDGALFDSISVGENVSFPLRRHTRKSNKEIQAIVHDKLEQVELAKEAQKMPSELSGGMRRRVGLARALALDPSVLLVDEPSSGLDRITAGEIYELLDQLKQKRHVAQVIVTHDFSGAKKVASRFAVLDRRKIVASASTDELRHSENSLVRELVSISEA